jgi:hypothetical protein
VCNPATGQCEGYTTKPDGTLCEPYPLVGLTGHFCIMGGCTGLPSPSGEDLGMGCSPNSSLNRGSHLQSVRSSLPQ